MANRLTRIGNWESVAHANGYSPVTLAKHHRLSVRQLERQFQSHFGKTPREQLRELRMRHAVALLRDGMAVKEIAYALHYCDPAHFTHEFKKHFGVTPSQYAANIAQ